MQAIEACGFVVERGRSGFGLAGFVAKLRKGGVLHRIWLLAEGGGPVVGDGGARRIGAGARLATSGKGFAKYL